MKNNRASVVGSGVKNTNNLTRKRKLNEESGEKVEKKEKTEYFLPNMQTIPSQTSQITKKPISLKEKEKVLLEMKSLIENSIKLMQPHIYQGTSMNVIAMQSIHALYKSLMHLHNNLVELEVDVKNNKNEALKYLEYTKIQEFLISQMINLE